ncbi:CBP80/20-dependent translation initiation factor-like isoform X2 [Littorina saxatilis]|uniref:MIF4G domain-containing protein n=1 Tax=Littorina saxatilis TaxID=31220 RepID=A0AAN9AZH5_9CAEN
MAGRGRGRGRGLLAVALAAKPTTPGGGDNTEAKISGGEGASKRDVRSEQALQDLENELNSLNFDPTDADLQRIEQLGTLGLTNSEDSQAIAKLVYEKVLQSREFAKAAAMVSDRLSNLQKEGTNFRSAVLSLVQVDYKGREELQKKSRNRFLGFLSFLTQLFGTMRLVSGEVMQPLVNPIYDCCDLVLETDSIDEDECECLSQQLQQIGRELQDNGEDRMQQLMDTCRSKIITEQTKPQVRCFLLELLEFYLRRWQMAPNDVTRFYCDTIADIMAGLVLAE